MCVNIRPKHTRGPPLKGKYPQAAVTSSWNNGRSSSHRSGRNCSASSPYKSSRRCIAYTQKATFSPLRMITGDEPSGPPPVGRTVVRCAVRVFTGTDGYSRRAVRRDFD